MSTTEAKALLRRFFDDLFTQGNLAVGDEIVGAGYINHNALPGEAPGRQGLLEFVKTLHAAVPDIQFAVEDQVAEGDKVVTRFRVTGTQQGELFGIPATGKRVNVTGTNIHRVANGQIHEAWLDWDALGMMQQLGVAG
jgi:steroid delta-isomerase-like uncharacterized protein